MSIKVSVIGAGSIFQNYHLNSILKQPELQINYLVDKNESMVTQLASKLNVIPLTDAKDIGECDICFIATPPVARKPVFDAIKDKGINSIVFEKPLAFDFETANHIAQESKQRGIDVYVTQTRRFFPNLSFIRHLINNHFFEEKIDVSIYEGGIFNWVTGSNYLNNNNPADHGVVHDVGAHVFDYLLLLVQDMGLKYEDVEILYSVFDFDNLANNCSVEVKLGNIGNAHIGLSRDILMMNKLIVKDGTRSVICNSGCDNKVTFVIDKMQFEVLVQSEYGQKDLDDAFDLLWKSIVYNYVNKKPLDRVFDIKIDSVLNTVHLIDKIINQREIISINKYFNTIGNEK